jgi:hypothetical protein
MILFPSVFCRGLSSLVRKFSNCGKQRLWYTIIDSEGSPLHRDLPDWTQVPEGILVDRFRDVVRNDNISIKVALWYTILDVDCSPGHNNSADRTDVPEGIRIRVFLAVV